MISSAIAASRYLTDFLGISPALFAETRWDSTCLGSLNHPKYVSYQFLIVVTGKTVSDIAKKTAPKDAV